MAKQDLTNLSKEELLRHIEQLQETNDLLRKHRDKYKQLATAYERILDKGLHVHIHGDSVVHTAKFTALTENKAEKPEQALANAVLNMKIDAARHGLGGADTEKGKSA